MKTLAGVWASAALLLALAAAPTAAEDAQVMVFGAKAELVHESAAADGASFSAAGLAQLAMDALGLPTATARANNAREPPAGAFSPVQADLFAHADGYALVLAEDRGAPAAVDAALGQAEAYHKLFPMRSTKGDGKAMTRLAGEFRDSGALFCAGSAARCADVMQTSSAVERVDADALVSQLDKLAFLDDKSDVDVAFARELAGVAQLADALALRQVRDQDSRALYVVALSDPSALDKSKREQARAAATEQVAQFLAALQTAHPLAGAQVVAVKRHPKSLDGAAAAVKSRRQLDSTDDADDESDGEEDEEEEEEEDEDEEEEEEEDEDEEEENEEEELNLEAEDGSSATATGNSTASPLTAQDIAEYQIVLWTSVVLAVALLLAVVAMGNMDVGRDSLLYAKFTTSAGHRKAD